MVESREMDCRLLTGSSYRIRYAESTAICSDAILESNRWLAGGLGRVRFGLRYFILEDFGASIIIISIDTVFMQTISMKR